MALGDGGNIRLAHLKKGADRINVLKFLHAHANDLKIAFVIRIGMVMGFNRICPLWQPPIGKYGLQQLLTRAGKIT